MMKTILSVAVAILSISGTAGARGFEETTVHSGYNEMRGRNQQFQDRNSGRSHNSRQDQRGNSQRVTRNGAFEQNGSKTPNGDQDIVRAVEARRHVNFVEGSGMVVIELLPDDNKGLRHQKFVVQLSNGEKMLAVYNLDMQNCNPIPVQKGDTVAMGGEFKWTQQGALLHWLHYDPSHRRPDGYVQHDGVDYCRSENGR